MYIAYLRSPHLNMMRLFFAVFVGLVLGLIFFRLGHEQKDIQPRVATMFIAAFFLAAISMSMALPFYAQQRAVFYRERASGMFHPFVYVISIILAEFPYVFLNSIVFTCCFYWLTNMENTAGAFFRTYLIIFLAIAFCVSFSFFFSILMPDAQLALVVISSFNPIFSMFAGFMISRPAIPPYWIWLYWINPFRYVLEAIVVVQMENVPFYCTQSELVDGFCSITNGNQILSTYGWKSSWYWIDVGAVCGFTGLFYLLSLVAIRFVNHTNR